MESDEELAARRIGQTVGRYRLDRVIGVGGMAAVYAARAADGSVAALKILHPEMSVRRDIRERFFREGYVANSIQHPGAVRALEHGDTADGGVYLALELLNGETLSERVKRHGILPQAELLDYADQVLDVLAVAHHLGIVHRDLKPDNLFVTYEGRIKILDFGLARLSEAAPGDYRTRSGMALGTLPYMAPEQALGRRAEVDHRVDLFALGATLFRILSGKKIHEGDSEAELLIAMASKPAPPLRAVAPSATDELGRIVDLALAFSRDARYPDARTMQGDIRAVRAGHAPPYATQRFASREEKTRTEPLGGGPSSSSGPKSTVPLHVYMASAPQSFGATLHPVPPAAAPTPPQKVRSNAGRWIAAGAGVLVLGSAAVGVALWFAGSDAPDAPTMASASAVTRSAPAGVPQVAAAAPAHETAPSPAAPALARAASPLTSEPRRVPAAAAPRPDPRPRAAAVPATTSGPSAGSPSPEVERAPELAASVEAASVVAPDPPAAAAPRASTGTQPLPAPEGSPRRRRRRHQ